MLFYRKKGLIKIKVIFQNSLGKERVIAEVETKGQAITTINKFLEEHNYTSYYTREWIENGRTKIDVGSHTEFFFLKEIT